MKLPLPAARRADRRVLASAASWSVPAVTTATTAPTFATAADIGTDTDTGTAPDIATAPGSAAQAPVAIAFDRPTEVERAGRSGLRLSAPQTVSVTNTGDSPVFRVLVTLMVVWREDSTGFSPSAPLRLGRIAGTPTLEGAPHLGAPVAPTQYWTIVVEGPLAPGATANLPLAWLASAPSALFRLGNASAVVTATSAGSHRSAPQFSLISVSRPDA